MDIFSTAVKSVFGVTT